MFAGVSVPRAGSERERPENPADEGEKTKKKLEAPPLECEAGLDKGARAEAITGATCTRP